ncbi:MAG TPA: TerC/Alx family metal homeostasis membrane protein [Alphaproteobacteria bacterium]|nr:TerC/Alx family metal homeostasis membrane protein [Alphaproteobacteria bacterium]
MSFPWWAWVIFHVFILLLLVLDLGIFHRKQHRIHLKEALYLSVFYIALGLLFAWGMYFFIGAQEGIEFLTGYLIEKSLSVDNIFVFVLIFTHFRVPSQYHHRVLFWGILGALVMRALLIITGASLIESFHWIIFVFGGFLIMTGLKMLWAINTQPDLDNNKVIQWLYKHLSITSDYKGEKFWIYKKDKIVFTPLFPVLILIEISDLIFAVDSIPAIFAISKNPFIVYTSNVFAILGLRALYFALADIIHRFIYLKYGLSIILILIGLKMILNGVFGEEFIPTHYALLATAILLAGSIILSLRKFGKLVEIKEMREVLTGWVPGSIIKKKSRKNK